MRFGQRYDHLKSPKGVSTPSTYATDATFEFTLQSLDSSIAKDEDSRNLRQLMDEASVTSEDDQDDTIVLHESSSLPSLRDLSPSADHTDEEKQIAPKTLTDLAACIRDKSVNDIAIELEGLTANNLKKLEVALEEPLLPRRRSASLSLPKSPFVRKVVLRPRARAPKFDFAAHLEEVGLQHLRAASSRQGDAHSAAAAAREDEEYAKLLATFEKGRRVPGDIYSEVARCQGKRYSILPDRRRMRKCAKFGVRYECDSPYCEGCNPLANLAVNSLNASKEPLLITGFEGWRPVIETGLDTLSPLTRSAGQLDVPQG
jgi:hypothetical protein